MNPVLNKKTFSNLGYSEETMTINGVINKSFILWLFLAAGAYLGWTNAASIINNYWWLIIIVAAAIASVIMGVKEQSSSVVHEEQSIL